MRSATSRLRPKLSCSACSKSGSSIGSAAAPIAADVRVIAATNRNLQEAVRAKSFREDLFYRLNVFPIRLPPLRERRDDIPLLVHFLITKFAMRIGKRIDGVEPRTMQRLLAYSWPGNIRELENVIERAVILAPGTTLEISADVLSANVEPKESTESARLRPATLEATEREHILAVLRQSGWLVGGSRGAAKILGVHPNTLRSRMKKLGIHRTAHDIS